MIGVGQVVACIERSQELYAALGEVLTLARDAVHVVVPHGEVARSRLIICTLIKFQNIFARS